MTEGSRAGSERSREEIQDAQYGFPYHFIPRQTEAGFEQSVTVRWGYLYWSYLGVVLEHLEKLRPASVLDVGSGDGRLVFEVATRLPGARVLGIDTSERAVALAQAMHPGGDFRSGDVTQPGFLKEVFDAITLVEVLEHVPNGQIPALRSALRQHLGPDGRLVVTVPTKNVVIHPKHYQHFDLDSLKSVLEPDFEYEVGAYLNRQSRITRLIDRLVTNRFFAVREPRLLGWLFGLYRRRFLHATPATAMRICAVFKPASGD